MDISLQEMDIQGIAGLPGFDFITQNDGLEKGALPENLATFGIYMLDSWIVTQTLRLEKMFEGILTTGLKASFIGIAGFSLTNQKAAVFTN